MIIQGCFPSGACFPRCAMINMLTSFTKVFGRYIYLGSFITSLLVQNSRLILVTSQFFSAFDYFQDSSPTSVDVYRLVTSSLKITDCLCLVPATNNSASAALITHVGKQQTGCVIEKKKIQLNLGPGATNVEMFVCQKWRLQISAGRMDILVIIYIFLWWKFLSVVVFVLSTSVTEGWARIRKHFK